jgi:hypothetical protein
MHWNYRIAEFKDKKGEKTYKLVEAYYSQDDKKKTFDKVTSWAEAGELVGIDMEDIKKGMELRAQAIERPVLKIKEKIKSKPKYNLAPVHEM